MPRAAIRTTRYDRHGSCGPCTARFGAQNLASSNAILRRARRTLSGWPTMLPFRRRPLPVPDCGTGHPQWAGHRMVGGHPPAGQVWCATRWRGSDASPVEGRRPRPDRRCLYTCIVLGRPRAAASVHPPIDLGECHVDAIVEPFLAMLVHEFLDRVQLVTRRRASPPWSSSGPGVPRSTTVLPRLSIPHPLGSALPIYPATSRALPRPPSRGQPLVQRPARTTIHAVRGAADTGNVSAVVVLQIDAEGISSPDANAVYRVFGQPTYMVSHPLDLGAAWRGSPSFHARAVALRPASTMAEP